MAVRSANLWLSTRKLCTARLGRTGFAAASLALLATAATAAPVILNSSSIAGSGDIIAIQGSGFGTTPTVWCTTNGGAAAQLSVLNSGNGVVQFALPSPLGLYGVYVMNGATASNTVYPNQANPMHFDTDQVTSGGTFRIFGRNLYLGSGSPRVDFVSGANSYTATVNTGPKYNTLSVTAPAGMPVGTYSVYVSNGFGTWTTARALCQQSMIVRASGPDTFSLGVPWSADLTFGSNIYNVKTDSRLTLHAVGDGVTNDEPAVQAAIDTAAAAGGGVVYMPAGNYKLVQAAAGGPLFFFNGPTYSKVVVQGAGQGVTNVTYGYGTPLSRMYIAFWWQCGQSGLCDMSISNLNQGGAWTRSGTFGTGGPNGGAIDVNEIFLARCNINIANGDQMFLTANHVVVENSTVTGDTSLLQMGQSQHYNIRNNTLTQTGGVHIDITSSNYGVVESNTLSLNANNGTFNSANVRHGMAIGFAQNDALINNTFTTFNGTPVYDNDGESILSEGGGNGRPGEESGTVSSASGTSMTLSKSASFVPGTVVAIINGTGRGQWRTITARTTNSITIDQPWLLAPDTTSTYAIFIWSNRNTTIDNNTFTGWLRGIWFYQGSTTDSQISNNHLNGMDGIDMRPAQNVTRGLGQFDPIWNTQVNNNTLTSSASTATEINMTADLQQTNTLIGTMALNYEVRNNSLTGTGATFFQNDPAWSEGYVNDLQVEASPYTDQSIPAVLGSIFQGNTANNCGQQAFLLNGGAYQTIIANSSATGDPVFLNDSTMYWNTSGTHASVNTVVIGQGGSAPTAPSNLTAAPASGQIALSWNPSSGATSYNVYRGTTAGGESPTPLATGITGTSYTNTGLTNGTAYYYKVAGVNANGAGTQSNEASATAGGPFTPTGLTATSVTSQVMLSWNAATGATSYNVYRGTTPGGESTTPIATGITTPSYTNSGLTNNTTYYYKVAAVNSVATSGLSNEAFAIPGGTGASFVTTDNTPSGNWMGVYGANGYNVINDTSSYPSYATVTTSGNSTATWNGNTTDVRALQSVSHPGQRIAAQWYSNTSFTVDVNITDGAAHQIAFYLLDWDNHGRAQSIQVLNASTSAVLDTRSATAFGSGQYWVWNISGHVQFVFTLTAGANSTVSGVFFGGGTGGTAPSAPSGLSATAGNTQVSLSWTAGSGATTYNIYRGTSSGGENVTPVATGITGTAYTNTGLTNGTQYFYTVAGVNGFGASSQSNEASATPTAGTVPSAPTGLSATAGNAQVSLSWTASSGATSYNLYRSTTAGGEGTTAIVTGITGTSYTNTGLTNGTQYFYKVAAVNGAGTSAQSSEASATPQVSIPSAPTGLTATAGNAQVILNWTASSGATSYNVYRSTTSGGEGTTAIATGITGTTYTNTGLTNGTQYFYKVAAVNAAGTSAQSSEASATPNTVPSAPTGLTASPGNAQVSLSWTAASGATSYNVYRSTTSGGEGTTAIATGITGIAYNDTGLTNGTTYFYKVAAVNSAGTSAQSSEASATPSMSGAPGTPGGVVAIGNNGQVTIAWNPSGGSTSYNIYRSATSGGEGSTPYAQGLTSTSWVDNGVANGTTYFYKVAAVNANGTSAQSTEASASPNASIPYAPGGLNTAAGNGQVILFWSSQSGATSYNLYRGTVAGGEGATPIASGLTGLGYLDNTAVNGTTYYYKLAAVNASGTSAQSGEVNSTPNSALTTAPVLTATATGGHINLSWTTVSGATSYNLFRSTTPGGEGFSPQATGLTGTSWTDNGVSTGTTYYYMLAGINGNGPGSRSTEVSATP